MPHRGFYYSNFGPDDYFLPNAVQMRFEPGPKQSDMSISGEMNSGSGVDPSNSVFKVPESKGAQGNS